MEEEELDLAVVKTENDCGVDDYLSGEEEQEQSDEEDEGPALTNLTRPVFHCQVGQCQESLPNQFSWREHVKSAHNLDPYDFLSPAPRVELVPLLSRPPPNLLPLQSSSPTDNDHAAAYQCVYKRCPVQISSLAALQKHLQTCHHKKSIRKPSLCPFPDCGEEFRPVNLLRLHLQSVHKSVANQILVSIQDKHEEPDDELEDTEDKPRNKGGRPKKDYFILTGNAIKDRGEYKCVYLHCHLPRRSLYA